MSFQATRYAAWICETDRTLTTTERLVLILMAETANHETGLTYAGEHIAKCAGRDDGHIRKVVAGLVKRGHIGVDRTRNGTATRYRFPVVGHEEDVIELSTTRASEGAGKQTFARASGAATRAFEAATRASGGARTKRTGVQENARASPSTLDVSGEWCTKACPYCEGGQWESQTAERPYAVPCRNRPLRQPLAL